MGMPCSFTGASRQTILRIRRLGEDKFGPKDELGSDSFDFEESKIRQELGRISMFVATQQHGQGMTTGKTGGG